MDETITETRICHHCSRAVGRREPCAHCVEAIPNRPDPATMTPDEREAELRDLGGALETSLDIVFARVSSLVGRSVYTHEMGSAGFGQLVKEARGESSPATLEEIVNLLPPGKVVLVNPPIEGPTVTINGQVVPITVTGRSDDWHVCLRSNSKVWACGKTVAEAKQDFVNAHAWRFGD